MIYELKKIDLWSAIKISFLVNAVIGLIIGLLIGLAFAFIVGLVSHLIPANAQDMPNIPFGPLGGFIIGMIYAMFIAVVNGIILTGIVVIMYNMLARLAGGLKLEVQATSSELIKSTMTIATTEQTGGQISNV